MCDKREIVTITKYHNYITIRPYVKSKWDKEKREEVGTCPKLDNKYLKYERFSRFVNKKDFLKRYDKLRRTLTLPITYSVESIEQDLSDYGVLYEVVDLSNEYLVEPRKVEYKINENYSPRNKFQEEAIAFLVTESLGYSKLLHGSTGFGKTLCGIFSAQIKHVPIFIISETLCDQWREKIEEYTDCTINNHGIKIIKGTDNMQKLFESDRSHTEAFYISTSSTVSAYIEKYGSMKPLYNKLGVGILCFDEYHMNWAQNMCIECDSNVKHLWRLTATPSRTEVSEKIIFSRMMKDVSSYGSKTATMNNFSIVRMVDYDTVPSTREHQSCFTYKGLSGVLYWNYIFATEERKMYIIGMVKMLLDPLIDVHDNTKILIYLAKLEHIATFKGLLELMYEKEHNSLIIGNYTTTIANRRLRKRELKNRIIFTTIGSGGVGLDIENLVAVFSLVPYSSEITTSQMIGRLRYIDNRELYFYDFLDLGFETMKRQRNKRMNVLKMKSKELVTKNISYETVREYLKDFY